MLLVSACSAPRIRLRPALLASLAVSFQRMTLAFLAVLTARPAATTVLTFALPALLGTICRMGHASIVPSAMDTALLAYTPTMWSAAWYVFRVLSLSTVTVCPARLDAALAVAPVSQLA